MGRLLQSAAENHKGGTDYSSSQLDFVGRPTQTKLRTLNGLAVETRTSYDPGGRPRAFCQTISPLTPSGGTTGAVWEPIARHSYNGIGEMISKTLGCNLQTVDYTYLMQGWLRTINDPAALVTNKDFFGMSLAYDNLGNITNQNYATINPKTPPLGAGGLQYAYAHTYDNLNRLQTSGLSQNGLAVLATNQTYESSATPEQRKPPNPQPNLARQPRRRAYLFLQGQQQPNRPRGRRSQRHVF